MENFAFQFMYCVEWKSQWTLKFIALLSGMSINTFFLVQSSFNFVRVVDKSISYTFQFTKLEIKPEFH